MHQIFRSLLGTFIGHHFGCTIEPNWPDRSAAERHCSTCSGDTQLGSVPRPAAEIGTWIWVTGRRRKRTIKGGFEVGFMSILRNCVYNRGDSNVLRKGGAIDMSDWYGLQSYLGRRPASPVMPGKRHQRRLEMVFSCSTQPGAPAGLAKILIK